MFIAAAFRTGIRLGLALVFLAALSAAAYAACLGVSRSINVTKFQPHLGASPSGGIGLRHKEVVLTFDDGPHAGTTDRVLAALQKECTKATFFVVGRMVRSNPGLLRQVKRAGHTIAHHTHDHANLPASSSLAIRANILRGMGAVDAALGRGKASRLFRYPYLARSSRTDKVVRNLGLLPLSAAIDSLDWKGGDFVGRTMNQLARKGRGVILLHDLKQGTAAQLPSLLRRLRQGGYKVVHLRGGRSTAPRNDVIASLDATKATRSAGLTLSITPRKDRRRSTVTVAKSRTGFFARIKARRLARRVAREQTYGLAAVSGIAKASPAKAGGKRKSFLERIRERRAARLERRKLLRQERRTLLAKADGKRPSFFERLRARRVERRNARDGKRTETQRVFALSLATLNPQVDPLLAEAELAFLEPDAMTDFDAVSELQRAIPSLGEADAEELLDDARQILNETR